MSSLFAPKAPATPQVMAPAPMPDANSPSVMEAQRQQDTATAARAGRASTILGKQGGSGGSMDSYSGSKLGSQ